MSAFNSVKFMPKDGVAIASESSMDRCCSWEDLKAGITTQSVACGNEDLDTAAATKYRDPKTMRGYVMACSPRRLAESVWL